MSKAMLSAASRVWARAAALQAEEAVMMASPSLRPQIYEDPVVYRPPPAVPRVRMFPPPYPPPKGPPGNVRPPTGPAHEHQDVKEQDEMWSDPRRVVEVEVFDEPAAPAPGGVKTRSSESENRTTPTSATMAALEAQRQAQKDMSKLEDKLALKLEPRSVHVASNVAEAVKVPEVKPAVKLEPKATVTAKPEPTPAVAAKAEPTPTATVAETTKPEPAPAAVAAASPKPAKPAKKPFVVDPNVDPATYLPQVDADPEDVSATPHLR